MTDELFKKRCDGVVAAVRARFAAEPSTQETYERMALEMSEWMHANYAMHVRVAPIPEVGAGKARVMLFKFFLFPPIGETECKAIT